MRGHNKLVSCITIFYNGEVFIREAIESVLSQTYRDWELILIDDGSSDLSTGIAKSYASLFPNKIFYYEHTGHKNMGMSASRNLGLSKSRGEFITFLDADDIWLPDKLEQQTKIMDNHPDIGMVYGRSLLWYDWPGTDLPHQKDVFLELGVPPDSTVYPPDLFFILLKNEHQSPTTCSALIRRNVFEKVGQFENTFRDMFEDQVFFSKVYLHFPVYVSGECWSKYRQHRNSCSARNASKNYFSLRVPFINWLETYLQNNDFKKKSSFWKQYKRQALLDRTRYRISSIKMFFKRKMEDAS